MAKATVLVADDDAAVRTVVNQAMVRAGFNVRVTSNFTTLLQWIRDREGDCVVSDVVMPDGDAFALLPRIREERPDLPVILISAQNTFMTALQAQEENAFDYLPKPFDLNKLVDTVERAINEPKPSPNPRDAQTYAGEMPLIGRSPPMQEIYRTIARLRQSTYPILITGERGTGKSLIARVIHDFGKGSDKPFRTVNLVGAAKNSAASGLFAEAGKAGSKQAVNFAQTGGTIYISDVLEMPERIQARFLQALNQAENNPERKAKAPRIVAATSGNFDEAMRAGKFSEDLYYRLAVIPIHVAPLRERLEDVPDLARHFLRKSELEGTVARHIDPEGMQLLKQHQWPGNVRELENLIRRLCLLHGKEVLGAEEIGEQLAPESLPAGNTDPQAERPTQTASNLASMFEERYFTQSDLEAAQGDIYQRFMDDYELPLLTAALNATNGNQIKAAKILGLNRNTLRKKITHHGIKIVRTVK